MPTIADMEQELSDQNAIRRVVVRQLARGDKPTRSHVAAHAAACDRITELELKLKRAKRRKG